MSEIKTFSAKITECLPIETESYKACRFIGKLKLDDKLEFDICVDNTYKPQCYYLNNDQKNSPFLILFVWVIDYFMRENTEEIAVEMLNNHLTNKLGSQEFNKEFFMDLRLFLDRVYMYCFVTGEEFKKFGLEYGDGFKEFEVKENR